MPPGLLFVHNHPAKFVQIDLALLRERYVVREWYQRTRVINIPALARAVAQSHLVFGWFAGWHTFFPTLFARMLKRPAVLVVGGYDTANMPEIGYGSQRGGARRQVARTAMRMATHLLAFSEFSRQETMRNAGMQPAKVGMIHIGVEDIPRPPLPKERLVVTASNVDRVNLHRKGLEPFVRAAAFLPDIPFVVIGAWRDDAIDYLRAIASPNVRFTGWVSDEELSDYFSRTRVYVQPSHHEGFGLSVAEAMMCQCVPVVTRAGSLPEVVGETGVYVELPEPAAIADAVCRALGLDDGWGQRARERIVREFPPERRRQGLHALVEELLIQQGRTHL